MLRGVDAVLCYVGLMLCCAVLHGIDAVLCQFETVHVGGRAWELGVSCDWVGAVVRMRVVGRAPVPGARDDSRLLARPQGSSAWSAAPPYRGAPGGMMV